MGEREIVVVSTFNSMENPMLVESYECDETFAEQPEESVEAMELIEKLGLTGQKSRLRKDDSDVTRNPYRVIRADERFAYAIICPKMVLLKDYYAGPIPLRILQIASHASEFFPHMKVMYQPETVVKDPVLIGSSDHYTFSSSPNSTDHILARWGDELESFPVLLARALEIARRSVIQEAERFLSIAKSATDSEIIANGPAFRIRWER